MSQVYRDGDSPVNPPPLRIPQDVADDPDLSDGARILFAEILELEFVSGICNATDEYFMTRRGKSRSAIQSQLKELRMRGHITVQTDKHTVRALSVADKYRVFLGHDFPGNRKANGIFPENNTASFQKTENNTHKTQESSESESLNLNLNNKDKTPKTPESYAVVLSSFLESDRQWMEPFLNTILSDPGYPPLAASARPNVLEMALLQACKARKDKTIRSSAIGIVASVLSANADCPDDYIAGRIAKLRAAFLPASSPAPGRRKPQKEVSDGFNGSPRAYTPYNCAWAALKGAERTDEEIAQNQEGVKMVAQALIAASGGISLEDGKAAARRADKTHDLERLITPPPEPRQAEARAAEKAKQAAILQDVADLTALILALPPDELKALDAEARECCPECFRADLFRVPSRIARYRREAYLAREDKVSRPSEGASGPTVTPSP